MVAPSEKKSTIDRIYQTVNNTDSSAALQAIIKTCHPEVQSYITHLEAINLDLQRQIGQLQAENTTLKNRIKVLIEENEKQEGQTIAEIMSRLRQIGEIA